MNANKNARTSKIEAMREEIKQKQMELERAEKIERVKKIKTTPALMTINQLSRFCGIGRAALEKLLNEGEINFVWRGNRRLVAEVDFWEWYNRVKTTGRGGIMAISSREVKNVRDSNGIRTGKSGIVYDVDIKINTPRGYERYTKKGFLTKEEAVIHENQERIKRKNPSYSPDVPELNQKGEMIVREYMTEWLARHKKIKKLQESTHSSYRCIINTHINPQIGNYQIRTITKEMLEDLFENMFEKKRSSQTVKNTRWVLSATFESARKNKIIEPLEPESMI